MFSKEDLLYGVLIIRLGLANPRRVRDFFTEMASRTTDVLDLARKLIEEGCISSEQSQLVRIMVKSALAGDGADVDGIIESFGGGDLARNLAAAAKMSAIGQTLDTMEWEELDLSDAEDPFSVTDEQVGRYTYQGSSRSPGEVAWYPSEIGRGGIGRVLVAVDQHLGREIAIKELLQEHITPADLRGSATDIEKLSLVVRFLREARITGQLEHPGIVPVYELGRRFDGTLYYSMKLVRGRTLEEAVDECKTLADRLKLLNHFVDLCQAIAYAHSRGVVHRDIKPANVMLGEFGETVVLDWGLAKIRGKKDIRGKEIKRGIKMFHEGEAGETVMGRVLGTPAYMSPEQALGRIQKIDERSDIWSLGIVLYELLAGRLPFTGKKNVVVLYQVIKANPPSLKKHNKNIPPELVAIVEKALRKEQEDRYQSARELAEDVTTYQSGARVGAYDYSSLELVRLFASRHKTAFMALGMSLIVVLLSLALVTVSYRDEIEAHQAEREARLLADYHIAQAHNEKALGYERERKYLSARIYAASSLLSNPAFSGNPRYDANFGSDHPDSGLLALEAVSRVHRDGFMHNATLTRVLSTGVKNHAVAFSPAGDLLAATGQDDRVRIWETEGWRLRFELQGHGKWITDAVFSADGRTLLTAGKDGTVRVWDMEKGDQIRIFETGSPQWTVAFSPTGEWIAAAGMDRRVRVWDLQSGEELRNIGEAGGYLWALAFSPDGGLLASAGDDGIIRLWNTGSWKQPRELKGHESSIHDLLFTSDSKRLVSCSSDRTLRLWSVADGRLIHHMAGHQDHVFSLALSPDDRRLVSVGGDRTIRMWDLVEGKLLSVVEGHGDVVIATAMSPDGALLATSSWDKTIRLWKIDFDKGLQALKGHTDRIYGLSYSADGRWLASASFDRSVKVWDLRKHAQVASLSDQAKIYSVSFSPDAERLAASYANGNLKILDWKAGRTILSLKGHEGRVSHTDFSPRGDRLVSGGYDKTLKMWDAESGRLLWKSAEQGHRVYNACFSPDGSLVASSNWNGEVKLWDAESGAELRRLSSHTKAATGLAFSHDGKRLASSGEDSRIVVWDVKTGIKSFELPWGEIWINTVCFSQDDRFLISASDDHAIVLWSLEERKPILMIRTDDPVVGIAYSPDTDQLAYGDGSDILFYPVHSFKLGNPQKLLDMAKNETGMMLDGFKLVQMH